MKRRYHIINSH